MRIPYFVGMETNTNRFEVLRRYSLASMGTIEMANRDILYAGMKKALVAIDLMGKTKEDPDAEAILNRLDAPEWNLRTEALAIRDLLHGAISLEAFDTLYPKRLCKMFEFQWDEALYTQYVQDYLSVDFKERIFDEEVSVDLMGIVEGVHLAIGIIDELIQLLDDQKAVPNIYWQQDGTMIFVPANEKATKWVYNKVFDELVSSSRKIIEAQVLDRETFIKSEINMFQAMFDPIHAKPDFKYLAKRLDLPKYDVKQIYKKRSEVLAGETVRAPYTYDQELRADYGVLVGIQEYIKYLENDATRTSSQIGEEVNPNTENLYLRSDYHKNLEAIYDLLKGEFILCDLETFKGVFIAGEFNGKVRLSNPTTVAELKLFLTKCQKALDGWSKIWKYAANCFERTNGRPLTRKSFNNADVKTVTMEREEKIQQIANTLLSK